MSAGRGLKNDQSVVGRACVPLVMVHNFSGSAFAAFNWGPNGMSLAFDLQGTFPGNLGVTQGSGLVDNMYLPVSYSFGPEISINDASNAIQLAQDSVILGLD